MKTKIFSILTLFLISITTSAQIDRSKQPKPGPAPKINLGEPQKFTLKNGLQVLVVENHKLPRVSATLTIDNPPMAYGDKKGVEGLLSGMVGTGSTNISKEKFDEEVDFLGANISFWDEGASASSLSKYFPRVLELMADAAFNPLFTQEEFDKQMKQSIDGIKSNAKSVTAIARRVESVLTYGKNHPFGEFTSEETLKKVTLQDVKALYNKTYKPNNAYLIVVGDVKYKKIKKQIKALFSSWEKGNIAPQSLPKNENPTTTEINFIDMPNAVQSELSIMNSINLQMGDKDYYAALLANRILGGGGTGRLYKNLREDKGYTYGSYSSIGQSRYASAFRATASVRNMVTDSSVVEAMKEINKIRNIKVSSEELEVAKAAYIGRFVRAVESPSTIASYTLNILQLNLPKDYYETYLQNINAVTVEDIQNAAKKYFKSDNARIIITGKGTDVLPNLEKNPLYKIHYFDKYGNPTKKPEMNLPIPDGVTASTVVDEYFEAIGGKDKVMAVKSVMITSTAQVQGMDITSVGKTAAPNKSSLVISGMGQVFSKIVFDGEKGYQEAMGQRSDLPADEVEKAKAATAPFADVAYKNGKLDRIEALNGKNAYVIKHNGSEIFYDVKTGLKIQEVTSVKSPQGDVKVPAIFSDYKEVNGVKFPHSINQKMGPMDLNFVIKEIKINEGVSDKDFK